MSKEKEKFFCMYHAQNIMKCTTPSGYSELMKVDFVAAKNQAFFLELTPLSHISDNDSIEVAKILFGKDISGHEQSLWIDKIKLNLRNQFGSNIFPNTQPYFSISWEVCDYLRSKGYSLPWNGITVEEQIKLGWIKLKDNE